MKAVIYSYGFFILANILDILSSLGQLEANPFMQDYSGHFSLSHGIAIKAAFGLLCVLASFALYKAGKEIHPSFGFFLAALVPVYDSYNLMHVFFNNVFLRVGWYHGF